MSIDNRLILMEEQHHEEEAAVLVTGLLETANEALGHPRMRLSYAATVRDDAGNIQGGLSAQSFWGWLYIVALAVEPAYRGKGYGRQLMESAEAWGVRENCRHAWLMTMTFQAKGFYEHLGYALFAALEDYPAAESRLFFRKSLTRGPADR
jgi:GNAT superfamily N-acetyltransferase